MSEERPILRIVLAALIAGVAHAAALGWILSRNFIDPPDTVEGAPINLELLAVGPQQNTETSDAAPPAAQTPKLTLSAEPSSTTSSPEPTLTSEPTPPPSPEITRTPEPTTEPTHTAEPAPPPPAPTPPSPEPRSNPELTQPRPQEPAPEPAPPPSPEPTPSPAPEPSTEPLQPPTRTPPPDAVLAPQPSPPPSPASTPSPKPPKPTPPKPTPTKPRPTPNPKPLADQRARVEAQRRVRQAAAERAAKPAERADAGQSEGPQTRRASSGSDTSTWRGEVLAHISAYKPSGTSGAGTALVAFSIDGSGRVLSASLARSSGDPTLDAASVAMVRRASPMPAPPAELGGRVRLTVPVHYQ